MWYQNALEQEPSDKRALRCLSMVIRKVPFQNDKEKLEALEESIQYAKKAVALDLKDSESWYILGNAHLTCFFMGGQRYENLDFALKAYTQSEKRQVYQNPDLYFNRGTICEYLENYREAISDYDTAHNIDPNLGARTKARGIQEFVVNICSLITKEKSQKSTKLVGLVKSISKSIGEVKFMKRKDEVEETKQETLEEQKEEQITQAPIKYSVGSLHDCKNGDNKGVIYIGKLVWPLKKELDVPIWYLMIDSNHEFSVLSLYNLNKNLDNLKYGDEIMIRDPNLTLNNIKYKKKMLSYPCFKIMDVWSILVNKQPLSETVYNPELVIETFVR